MDASSAFALIAVVVLVALNGFFVAAEFAIVSVRRSRLEQMEADGSATARAANEVVHHLDTYIAACQLGITMASLAIGWLGEPAFAHLIEPPLETVIGQFAPAAAHGVAIGLSFAIITALHIVMGEQVPKLIGLQRAEATTLLIARPMQFFNFLFGLPVAVLNNVGNAILKLIGLQPGAGHEMVHSVEELRMLVAGSQKAGEVEASEARIASRAFVFADLTAGELMTPRTEVEAVPATITRDELLAMVVASTHTRLPVYDGSLDNVLGVLYVHDCFSLLAEAPESFNLARLIRPALAVPASKPADDLLDEMRERRKQLAVVVDEYGGTAGIVTLEDLMEALVGRIDEELPANADAGPAGGVPKSDGLRLIDGLTRLGELEELTGARLEEDDHEVADTVGGLIMARLGRIPEPGDEVVVAGRTLRVEELDGRRVATVRLLD